MSQFLASFLILSFAFAGTSAAAHVTRATGDNFNLFAYGDNTDTDIGGYPIIYNNGLAYIADPSQVNYTAYYVNFTKGTSDSTEWFATAKHASNSTSSWSNSTWYITSPSGDTGFYTSGSNVSTDDLTTTGFTFYGTTAMLEIGSTLYSKWYAFNTSTSGLWSILWNSSTSNGADGEALTISSEQGSNVVFD